jgi:hypothetical protein
VPPPPIIRTTHSRRHVRFPARFNNWATISAGGWCGNLPQMSTQVIKKILRISIWITSKISTAILAHCFNSHGYHTLAIVWSKFHNGTHV